MRLAQMQAAFQAAVLEGDSAILTELVDSPHESRAQLLSVYQRAYRLRLMGVLGNDYPLLKRQAGDDEFAAIAAGYIAAHVSTNPDVSHYGSGLPGYLAVTAPWPAQPVLVDLARLERALAVVFAAADDGRLQLTDLAALAPEDWPDLSLAPHTTACHIDLTSNARALWRALSRDEAPPAPALLAAPETVLVFRPELTAKLRPMAAEDAMMWKAMSKGLPFGALCEMVAAHDGEDGAAARAAGYLAQWVAEGALA